MSTIRRCLQVSVLAVGLALVAASPALSQSYTGVIPPNQPAVLSSSGGTAGPSGAVLSSSGGIGGAPVGQVLATQVSQAPVAGNQARVSGLAFTGSDVATLVLLAVPLILVGAVLTRRSRSRSTAQG